MALTNKQNLFLCFAYLLLEMTEALQKQKQIMIFEQLPDTMYTLEFWSYGLE